MLLAGFIELGNDEVYYYTYALHLQPNYFDHPPGVAVLIKLFTLNLTFASELFLRLGAIVCAAVATWLCFIIGRFVRNERTGWLAAILYNTSIYTSIIAGNFILPDSPQVVCWLAAVLVLLRLVLNKHRRSSNILYWLAFGILAGLCIMCKVHGVFLWVGVMLYILLFNRGMLKHAGLYMALVVTAAVASPILFWNIANNFVTWRFHSSRVAVNSLLIKPGDFMQAILGQVFYNNPFNVAIIITGALMCCRRLLVTAQAGRVLFCIGLPIIVVVNSIALWRDVLPHWSGPGFMTISFLGAAWLDDVLQRPKMQRLAKVLFASTWMFISVIAVGAVLIINFYPGTIGSTSEAKYGDEDFTLDMYGWQTFGTEFMAWQQNAVKSGQIPAGLPIVCNKWFPAAHIDYYVARNNNTTVTGVGFLTDLHQYAWLNHMRGGLITGHDALCIVPSNYPVNMRDTYGAYFNNIVLLKKFVCKRSKITARYFNVYLLKGYKCNDEVHFLIVK